MDKKTEEYDVVIIGGGSAGLTAGIYCSRAKLKTLVIEKTLIGGLATYTNEIENYPGFPDGIGGLELMELFKHQGKKFGLEFKLTDVKSIDFSSDIKIVETFRIKYEAKVVIVASGGTPRLTKAKNEALFLYDKGISFCATCDAASNIGKTVMVIGSGDAAIEESIFLTKFASKVIISVIHDEGIMDCNEIAKAEAINNSTIEFIYNTIVDSFEGDKYLKKVLLKNIKTNKICEYNVDKCFVFIGYLPNTKLFENILNVNENKYLLTNEKMETNIPGVFAAGDVRKKILRQISTCVSDGAIAGFCAEKYISESKTFNESIINNKDLKIIFIYNTSEKKSADKLLVLNEFEKVIKNKIEIIKIDTYKSDGIAKRLGEFKVPSVIFLKDKKIIKRIDDITLEALRELYTLLNMMIE